MCATPDKDKERVKSNGLAIGANDFDARGRSPMSRQRIHLSLGGEAGGRSPGLILASEVPLRSGEVKRQCRRTGLLQRLTSYRISVLGLEPLRNHPFEPRLHSNAWAAISARETPVLLGIFGGRLQHPMRPPL